LSAGAGKWGLRVLALVAAFAVWFAASFAKREHQSEKVIDAGVTYNAPRGFVILDPVQSVKVRLRGPDRAIRNLAPQVVDVVVSFDRSEVGTVDIPIAFDQILRPVGISVLAVEPNSIRLRLDRELIQELPVTPRLVGEPAGGAVPLEPVSRPARVRVSGPQSILSGLAAVSTSPISLDGHALTFEQTASVISPIPLVRIIEPSFVSVEVPMGVPGTDGERAQRSENP
jgi:YbbR domain-containing protein